MHTPLQTLYDLVGVTPKATAAEIRRAYLLRARVLHPDRFDRRLQPEEWEKANEMLRELNAAYAVVSDPGKRQAYDASVTSGAPSGSSVDSESADDQDFTAAANRGPKPRASRISSAATHFRWRDLPPEVQARILERQKSRSLDQVRVAAGGPLREIVLGVLGACGLWLFSSAIRDHKWTGDDVAGWAVVAYGCCTALVWAALRLLAWLRSPVKSFVYLTPLYFIRTQPARVSYWWLWDLVGLDTESKFRPGTSRMYTQVKIRFDDGEQSFSIRSPRDVADLRKALQRWRDGFETALRANDVAYFISRDDFLRCRELGLKGSGSRRRGLARAALFGVPGVLATLLVLAGISLNDYYDDEKAWAAARAFDRAGAYRRYLATHPDGRWKESANTRITEIYDNAKHDYRALRTEGFDADAGDAVDHLLTYAHATGDFRITVHFEGTNQIPVDIEGRLQHRFGLPTILPIGESFSQPRMRAREQHIVHVVAAAFRQIVPEDVLSISESSGNGGGPEFVINYDVRAGESVYYRHTEENLPDAARTYYPGISVAWRFRVFIPAVLEEYAFLMNSHPAKTISYQHAIGADEKGSIYDSMSESAFDDFRAEIVKRFGLRGSDLRGEPDWQPVDLK